MRGCLQAIVYRRGSLKLLDQVGQRLARFAAEFPQRELPFKIAYLEIKDSSIGWKAIKDMVVRGAPVIAIAAALSVAVEAYNLRPGEIASPDAAAEFLGEAAGLSSLEPTNLANAAEKLKKVASSAANVDNSSAEKVFQAYIEAAEAFLEEDVSSNKAIGKYGSSFLLGRESCKLGVLTHCNTGSLATGGYGTALGVIRALHLQNLLHTAFCTETRPYNQGSRLTAFELVHDRIPAVLIADFAAASLQSSGRVDAVIVGADRIAANAAPLTSVDLSISSGNQIAIEDRSSLELQGKVNELLPREYPSGILPLT